MRLGVFTLLLMILRLSFEADYLFPSLDDIKPEDYQDMVLTGQDSVQAVKDYRYTKHLRDIEFYKNRFMFQGLPIALQTHTWMALTKFVFAAFVTWIFFWPPKRYDAYIGWFAIVLGFHFVMYFVNYNMTWFNFGIIPVDDNTVGIAVYTMMGFYTIKQREKWKLEQ